MGAPGRGGTGIASGFGSGTGGRAYAIAIVLSLVLPGLGHLATGRRGRGIIWLVGAVAMAAIFITRDDVSHALSGGLLGALAILAAADAAYMVREGD